MVEGDIERERDLVSMDGVEVPAQRGRGILFNPLHSIQIEIAHVNILRNIPFGSEKMACQTAPFLGQVYGVFTEHYRYHFPKR